MSTRFDIGPGVSCDLDLLIASRLLVQASSGQGKTRTIRRILEQTHGKVQHLVIDPEGEYHTLRERFDYVLAAPRGGDVVAHPKHAALLAHELLRLNVSAICDIYELNPDDRRLFVKHFLMALVNAPRELWHPVLVVLDEAHIFCPEKGDAVSAGAVEALSTRGRKRGFCLIAATQRLAKFKKDAAAELGNKLIGGTNLDIDIDRAGEELGMPKAARAYNLRGIQPGYFYAFGRAFAVTEPTGVMVGPVRSTHPEPGQAAAPIPAPSAKVKAVLEKLSALPAEAEEHEKTLAGLQKENAELKRAVQHLERNQKVEIRDAVRETRVEVPVFDPETQAVLLATAEQIRGRVSMMYDAFEELRDISKRLEYIQAAAVAATKVGHGRAPARSPVRASGGAAPRVLTPAASNDLTEAQQKILGTVFELQRRGLSPNVEMIARWLGIHPNGGRFRGNLRELMNAGQLTDDYQLPGGASFSTSTVYAEGLDGLPISEAQRAIVRVVDGWSLFGMTGTVTAIAKELGIHPNGGRFRGNIKWLRTMGVLEEVPGGLVLSKGARE